MTTQARYCLLGGFPPAASAVILADIPRTRSTVAGLPPARSLVNRRRLHDFLRPRQRDTGVSPPATTRPRRQQRPTPPLPSRGVVHGDMPPRPSRDLVYVKGFCGPTAIPQSVHESAFPLGRPAASPTAGGPPHGDSAQPSEDSLGRGSRASQSLAPAGRNLTAGAVSASDALGSAPTEEEAAAAAAPETQAAASSGLLLRGPQGARLQLLKHGGRRRRS